MQEESDQETRKWIILTFSLPREPSAPRVAIWRKLKQLGAICLHDGPWVLPGNKATLEHLRWLASEVRQKGGDATVWAAENLEDSQDEKLTDQFCENSDREYREILETLGAGGDRVELSKRYLQVQKTDYFQAPLGPMVLGKIKGGEA